MCFIFRTICQRTYFKSYQFPVVSFKLRKKTTTNFKLKNSKEQLLKLPVPSYQFPVKKKDNYKL
jgi:hypothetical protein